MLSQLQLKMLYWECINAEAHAAHKWIFYTTVTFEKPVLFGRLFCDMQEGSPLSTSTHVHASNQMVDISHKALMSHSNSSSRSGLLKLGSELPPFCPNSAEDALHSLLDGIVSHSVVQ